MRSISPIVARDVKGWALLLVLWAVASRILPTDVPGIAKVFRYLHVNAGAMAGAFATTASEAFVGLMIAAVLAVFLALLTVRLRWLEGLVFPVVIVAQTTPILALAPLVMQLCGSGWLAKMITAAIVASLPLILGSYEGLRRAEKTYVALYRLAGARGFQILVEAQLPSAAMALIPALRAGSILAVVGAIVADFLGGNRGLGFYIMRAGPRYDAEMLFSTLIMSALLGWLLVFMGECISSRLLPSSVNE